MGVLLVIPARFASTRFPGKPLAPLVGASGIAKPLIERSYEAAQSVEGVDRIVVATDDDRIADKARGFGAEVVMTPEACRNGTERCAAVVEALDYRPEIIVNLQGDAPLTPPWFVEAIVGAISADPDAAVTTPVLRCGADTLASLLEDRRAGRVGGTTVVVDRGSRALYFSKEVIPYTDGRAAEAKSVLHHVGVYAYRREALTQYVSFPVGALEAVEGLEQLRFLENGLAVRCVEVEGRGRTFWELNNPTDVPTIEQALAELGIE